MSLDKQTLSLGNISDADYQKEISRLDDMLKKYRKPIFRMIYVDRFLDDMEYRERIYHQKGGLPPEIYRQLPDTKEELDKMKEQLSDIRRIVFHEILLKEMPQIILKKYGTLFFRYFDAIDFLDLDTYEPYEEYFFNEKNKDYGDALELPEEIALLLDECNRLLKDIYELQDKISEKEKTLDK